MMKMVLVMGSGIGGHARPIRGVTNDWLTPPWLLSLLGTFDLDPCASINQPWRTALTQWTIEDDGFNQDWFGRVWLNPPYGQEGWQWINKLAKHGSGITIIFARTETKGFFREVWGKADGLLFIEGRLTFHRAVTGIKGPGNSGGPSVLVSYGELDTTILFDSDIRGQRIDLR